MTGTLYAPPRKPLVSRRLIVVVVLVLAVIGLGAALVRQRPSWLDQTVRGVLGLFGYELVSVEVETTPRQTNILLDGERMTELPLHVRRDGENHKISAIAPGFEPTEVVFRADGDKHLLLTLKPSRH